MDQPAGLQPRLIAETEDWLVADKPPGWLSIPGAGTAPVLIEWLRERHGDLWVVHRLDRDTSGVVLFARSADAHRRANHWFQAHEVRKEYDCIATGSPAAPVFKVREAIEGAPSTSQIEVRERFQGAFLARVLPLTGRRHQIRIHLSKAGYPLCGDPQYGGPRSLRLGAAVLEVPRVALHAAKLQLPSGEKFEAPWPEDFASWVRALRETAVAHG